MQKELENARSIADIFDIVKRVVKQRLGLDGHGLLVGLSDLGAYPGHFIGAFYDIGANTIIINKRPLQTMPPRLWNGYLFHILLHEYIHSLGFLKEEQVRLIVATIVSEHTPEVPTDIAGYMRYVTYGEPTSFTIDYVTGIDRRNTNYIM